jgi:hypothetical protein
MSGGAAGALAPRQRVNDVVIPDARPASDPESILMVNAVLQWILDYFQNDEIQLTSS